MDHTDLDEKTINRIVRELGRRRSRDLIIQELCETTGVNWSQAEQMLKDLELYNSIDIYYTQRIVLILLGSTISLAGFVISGYMVYEAINGMVMQVFDLSIPYPNLAAYFILGLLMMIGGIRGIINS